jgi:predicted permease
MGLLDLFLGTLEVTLPVFAMVIIGILLGRIGWIDTHFISTASALVFKATMPTLLFLSIIKADLTSALQPGLILYYLGVSTLCFLLVWGWSLWRCPYADRGVFVQGAFRGNCGIVGLALAASMYGDYGLSLGGIMAGGIIVLNLVLSAIILALYSPTASSNLISIFREIAVNPLILSILAAIPVAYFGITLPSWLMTSGEYFGSLSLPLALICIGGSLTLKAIHETRGQALDASLWKIIWMPAIGVLLALPLGFRGAELGILCLFLASPGAAISYVMAKSVGGNAELAANIIVISTFGSMATISLGVFALKLAGMV